MGSLPLGTCSHAEIHARKIFVNSHNYDSGKQLTNPMIDVISRICEVICLNHDYCTDLCLLRRYCFGQISAQ